MGLFGYYRQFEGLTEEEANSALREQAEEARSQALARVDPIDLSRTTWPELPPAEIVNAVTYHARRGLHRYAEGRDRALRDALADRHRIDADRIVIGEGASGLMQRAAQELVAPGDEVIVPWPGYPLYPLLARDAQATPVPVRELDPAALLAAVTPKTRMLVVGSPHDPTGQLLGAAVLEELLQRLPERVVVLLDEALREFVTAEPIDATIALTERHPRLIVVRSFSKAWGLAGLRCGYAIGAADAREQLRALAPRLGAADLSLAGAQAALRTASGLLTRRVRQIADEREALTVALQELGLQVTPSQSVALWVRSPDHDGGALHDQLARGNVIAQAGAPLGDDRHVRITVRDAAATRSVVHALREGRRS